MNNVVKNSRLALNFYFARIEPAFYNFFKNKIRKGTKGMKNGK